MIPERASSAPLIPLEAPEPATGAEEKPSVQEWSLLKRLLFRFSFVYLVLYCLPFPLTVVPYAEVLAKPYQWLWDRIVPMVAWMAFRIDTENRPNGSGDTTFDWMQVLTYLVVAVVATAVWTWLGRRQTAYPRLQVWLRVYVRFFLATFMLLYGTSKAIKSQFAFPMLGELLQPIGESSPMGLVWDFMGASTAYTMFTGMAEMLGGFLLAFRRTTLLGALVSFGAMANVLMLNLCYDVPVKLFSAHLLLMAVFLMLPDLKRLADLFLLNRRVERVEERPLFASPRRERIAQVAGIAFVLLFAGWWLYRSRQDSKQYGDLMTRPPLYGIWRADEVVVDGVARPPLLTDGTRWRYLIFDYPESADLRLMDASSKDGHQYFKLKLDEAKGRMAFSKYRDPKWRAAFSYRKPAPDVLEMQGTMDGQAIRARLRRIDETKLMLVGRGFHWVSEYPMNH
jgi:hypothetical protein